MDSCGIAAEKKNTVDENCMEKKAKTMEKNCRKEKKKQ